MALITAVWGQGGSLLRQRLSLADTEPVLFVGNDQGKLPEIDGILDQRVGSHHEQPILAGDFLPGHALFPGRHRTHQAHHLIGQTILLQHLSKGLGMLSCQNLCGRHNRRLISLADRVQHGEKGHHGLPGSHISLNQPLRDKRSPQILPQAVQALPLSRCQFIGQSRRCPLHQIVLCHRRKSPVVFYRALILLLELRTEKEIEKFFVHKTVSGLQQAVEGLRKMNLPIGLLFSRKLFPLHHKAGEQVSRKFHRIQRLTDRFF